jgi:hypothetical protein
LPSRISTAAFSFASSIVPGRSSTTPSSFLISERVQEIHQHGRVFFHQPGADEGGGGGIEMRLGQRGQHRGVPLGARLAFEKNRADVLGFGDGGERGFVGRLVRLEDEGQNVIRQRGRHETEEFVGLEHLKS